MTSVFLVEAFFEGFEVFDFIMVFVTAFDERFGQ
jgi:hypothetical protein